MNCTRLMKIRDKIEDLDKSHHPDILRILNNNNVIYTENRNGIFVNMTRLNEKTLQHIERVVTFIEEQKEHLDTTEQIKKEYQTIFFSKDNKEKEIYTHKNDFSSAR